MEAKSSSKKVQKARKTKPQTRPPPAPLPKLNSPMILSTLSRCELGCSGLKSGVVGREASEDEGDMEREGERAGASTKMGESSSLRGDPRMVGVEEFEE